MVMWSPSQTGGFSPEYSGFLPHKDNMNANNEHD